MATSSLGRSQLSQQWGDHCAVEDPPNTSAVHHYQCATTACTRSQGTHTCKQASSREKCPSHTSCPQEVCEQNFARAQILIHTAYDAYFLLKQVVYCVSCMLNMALCTHLPILTIFTWLSISMYATVVRMHTPMSEKGQPSKCVQRPRLMQTCVTLVSLLSITASLTIFVLTQVHCMLTLAAAYSFLHKPTGLVLVSCCYMLYAPTAIDQLTISLDDLKAYTCHDNVITNLLSRTQKTQIRSTQDTERQILETNQEQDTMIT